MSGKTYSTGDAAKKIGVSRQTLQNWIAEGKVKPPKSIKVGRVTVRLWKKVDVERIRRFKGTLKPGPKPEI